MSTLANAHTTQLSLAEVVAKYPDIPRLVIIKADVQRRGAHYTDRALSLLDLEKHQITGTHIFGARDGKIGPRPESLLLRDGTSIITTPTPPEQDPYVVDVVDGRIVLVDREEVVEEVEYWPRPDFYSQSTADGTPLKYIVSARPKRLSIFPYRYCHFWNEGEGCLFCDIVPQLKKARTELGVPTRAKPEEIGFAVGEALKEPGRFTGICITGGSILSGTEAFDDEVDYYIEVLKAIGANFRDNQFPSQLIATAFSEKQLQRLHDETGLMSYTADIEVLDERLFEWICPGKARQIGYREWKHRLVRAAEIFGRGRVDTGIVAGVELAKPHGFISEDEAYKRVMEEAEDLASQGVSTVFMIWSPRPGTALGGQKNASLDYYIRLAQGFHRLRQHYGLKLEFDDFRNCGNHPDSDLARV
jgi:hypothetical protein